MKNHCLLILIPALFVFSCKPANEQAEEKATETVTPVTVTGISSGALADTVLLNATSKFLVKTNVNASVTGYLGSMNLVPGQKVAKGQTLFHIRSKESVSVGNVISKLDTSFHFNGILEVRSPANGFITEIAHQQGDYVQEGESLAVISDASSLAFLLQLPYELTPLIERNRNINLVLPDGKKLTGFLDSSMPFLDEASQTQNYIIRLSDRISLPENLIATVFFMKQVKNNSVTLPREAVLTNEQQSSFWIMKLTDDSTAVKVYVQKGIETPSRVEILSPLLNKNDRIVLNGNYGLPDTAKVSVEK
ncbi:MAG TPA: efflux RND transporter periplasmic adaptor subunit [Bacteroidales bacterium]|nr:efflux RND transporter periplasmic adaptor subunit [Bacteroidales bacterium]